MQPRVKFFSNISSAMAAPPAVAVHIAAACIADVDPLMRADEHDTGVVAKWSAVEDALDKHGYVYIAKDVDIDSILIHPENRSTTMINPPACHRTGGYMRAVGVKRHILEQNALAIELCPVEPMKSFQLDKNREVASRANGLLKTVVGDERFLTVASTHAIGLFRAAKHRLVTPEKTLQDEHGRIDVAAWSQKQPEVGQILAGITIKVVRWEAAAHWPGIPDLASRARNGAGAVQVPRPELEVLANVATISKAAAGNGKTIDWKAIVAEATTVPAQCNDWAIVFANFAQLYADGVGAPLVFALDRAVKAKFAYRNMGEELWRTVTFTTYPHNDKRRSARVVLRFALLYAILTCSPSKIKNGLCSALTCSDIAKFAQKSMVPVSDEIEDMILKARGFVNGDETCEQFIHELGGRLIYHTVKKGKASWDGEVFNDFAAIGNKFVRDCNALRGDAFIAMPEEWHVQLPTAPECECVDTPDMAALTMADHASPVMPLTRKGIVEGAQVSYTDTADKAVWIVTSIGKNGSCMIKEHVAYGTPRKATISVDDMLKNFRRTDATLTKLFDPAWKSLTPSTSLSSHIDLMRGIVFAHMIKLSAQHEAMWQRLLLMETPRELRADTTFKAGELTLVPAVPLRSIVGIKQSKGAPNPHAKSVGVLLEPPKVLEAIEFWIMPMSSWPKLDVSPGDEPQQVTPFFWVQPKADEADVNMKFVNDAQRVHDVTITVPLLVSARHIKKHERLCTQGKAKPPQVQLVPPTSEAKAKAQAASVAATKASNKRQKMS